MQRRTLFIIVLLVVILGGAVALMVTRDTETNSQDMPTTNTTNVPVSASTPASAQLPKLSERPVLTISTSFGDIRMKLYVTDAPELTKNFLELAKSGYYDNLTFHRIVPGFVIQGGDPTGTGTGGRSYKGEGIGLADEAGALALKHLRGSVAWAKSSLPNSIGSQFYIALDDLPQLDGSYSVFGHVIEGMDVVEKIASVQTDASDTPLEPVRMTKVSVKE